MYEELNKKIKDVKEGIRAEEKLKGDLKSFQQLFISKRDELVKLEILMEKEKKDVDKLEGLTITTLFYKILGSKEKQMEKERQEFLAAKLKYDECKNSVKYIEEEIDVISSKLNQINNYENEYKNLLKEKENILKGIDDERGKEYIEFSEKEANINIQIKEIEEAIYAGRNSKNAIKGMIDELKSAENWGTWDMIGGGTFSTAVKHSKIDSAREKASAAQSYLYRFSRELSDVINVSDINLNIDINSFDTFADYFFDGLIADWIVQSKISDSLSNAQTNYYKVRDIVNKLNEELSRLNLEMDNIRKEKEDLLESL